MKKNNILLKSILSCLLMGCLFSAAFANTTQRGRDILEELRDDGRANDEIRIAMKDLGYNPNEYLGVSYNSTIKSITANPSSSNSNYGDATTAFGREIISQYRKKGRTDDEIKEFMRDLGLDTSIYFSSNSTSYTTSYQNNDGSTYISRSCKPYTVQYIQSLNAYTSPDLNRKEYFVNIDYFKRYIDSKNAQNPECSAGEGRISSSYTDTYTGTDRYTAPNGKIYFITQQNGSYTSSELGVAKSFSTIDELRNYIKQRNPLINMGLQSILSLGTTSTHGSTEVSSVNEIDYSEEAKHQRDIARKNDIAQIQTTILTSRIENNKTWPGMKNNDATEGVTMAEIAKDLETAGLTYVPFDPISSNTVSGLGTIRGVGEYIYMVTKSNGIDNAGSVVMAKPETEEGANRIVCDGEKDFDNGYITNSTDINDIQYCTSFIKTNYCKRDNQGRSNTQKCYYSDDSQLRYILTY